MNYPFVIWTGTEPLKSKGRFRLVHRGPARPERPDDVPFGLEQCLGVSFMKVRNWGPVKDVSGRHAIHALAHALGSLLTVDPKKLNTDHPLFCELNLAIAEGRPSRGCDCHAPADPLAAERVTCNADRVTCVQCLQCSKLVREGLTVRLDERTKELVPHANGAIFCDDCLESFGYRIVQGALVTIEKTAMTEDSRSKQP